MQESDNRKYLIELHSPSRENGPQTADGRASWLAVHFLLWRGVHLGLSLCMCAWVCLERKFVCRFNLPSTVALSLHGALCCWSWITLVRSWIRVVRSWIRVVRSHPVSSGVIRSHPESSGVVWSHPKSSEVIRSRQESSGVIRSRPESSGVVRSHTESSGVVRSRTERLVFCGCLFGGQS